MSIVPFSGVGDLPTGNASDRLTEGCLVLEGGAFRGIYSEGVLDVLMQNDLNLQCVIGVSAGAMNGICYVSGQVGRTARLNLGYRRLPRYVGLGAYKANQGVIGFDFAFREYEEIEPLDWKRFEDPRQRFLAVVTNCETGQTEYMEQGVCTDIFQAVRASASMPYMSKMVEIDGKPYLDGGCSCKIAYQWALDQGFQKIVVVRTRPRGFRKPVRSAGRQMARLVYHKYPQFAEALGRSEEDYNRQCDEIERLEAEGKMFVIYPSIGMEISRLESDMEKLGQLYYLGRADMIRELEPLQAYLKNDD